MKDWFKLLKREFRYFGSNSVVMAIFLGAPLLYGLLLGGVYQKGKVDHLPILVIDLDNTPLSHQMIDMMDDSKVLLPEVVYNQNGIRKRIIDKEYHAVVTIPNRFEANILQTLHPEVVVEINTANILTANYSAKAIQLILGTLNAGIEMEGLKKQGIPAVTAATKFEAFGVSYARFFNSSANYMTFLWPGVLGVIIQQVFMLALALSFAREFEEKSFFTDFMPKAKNIWNAMFIKALPFWVMGIGVLVLLRLMFPLFKIPFHANGLAMMALLTALILSVTFMGILVSIAVPNQLKATEILMVIATPSFILSGFTWPLSQMPGFIVSIANTIPLTHFLEALRKLLLYQASVTDIIPQIKNLMILTLIFAMASYVLLKVKVMLHAKSTAKLAE
tara:strand:- start:36021 stop:37193 length:1173 start_codon:yes stop_codon:yes gene_type:complete